MRVIYARVSTKRQAEKGKSISCQIETIKRFYNNIDFDLIITDNGISGQSLDRKGYKELEQLINKNKVKEIYVVDVDRLHRNNINFQMFMNLCEEKKISIYAGFQKIEYDKAIDKFTQNLASAIAQLEAQKTGERVKRNTINEFELGKYALGGKVPYGFKKSKDLYLSYNENEVEIVKFIFKQASKGLNNKLIKDKLKEQFNINFSVDKIRVILKTTLYLGFKEYNNKKYYLIEPIITEKEFDLANNHTKYRKKVFGAKYDYLFKNKVFLNEELVKSSASNKKGKIHTYLVFNGKYINENKIVDFLKDKFNDKELIENQVLELKKYLITNLGKLSEVRECEIQNEIKELQKNKLNNIKEIEKINFDLVNKKVEVYLPKEKVKFDLE